MLINYALPERALGLLISLVVAAMMINWAMISLSHLRFRRAKRSAGVKTLFPAPWHPFTHYLCLAFLASVLLVMLATPDMRVSVLLIPLWLLLLRAGYIIKQRRKTRIAGTQSATIIDKIIV